MGKKKILFASQEINPYLPETYMSNVGLNLPKNSIELGNETRVFLPKFGVIKEKANNYVILIGVLTAVATGINMVFLGSQIPILIIILFICLMLPFL